jgi:hypothetical protein
MLFEKPTGCLTFVRHPLDTLEEIAQVFTSIQRKEEITHTRIYRFTIQYSLFYLTLPLGLVNPSQTYPKLICELG